MLNKGTVMEAYRDWAVIMNDRCEFIKIRTKNILVPGENIEYLTKDIIAGRNFLTRNLSIAASFIICFITAAFIFQYISLNRVYAYIGLEINPSLEIAVNNRNLVAGVRAFDEEGLKLVQENNFSKIHLETALKELLAQSLEYEYLHGDNPNVIGVSVCTADSGELMAMVEETIKEVLAENNIESTIFIFHMDKQTREEAVKNNVSPIRYLLWTKAKEQGLSLPFEEIALTNPRDFNNACMLSDKATYQFGQEEFSGTEGVTEEGLPLIRAGAQAGAGEEKSVQQNIGPSPAGQGNQASGMPQNNQAGKINEAASPYQKPDGSGQLNPPVPDGNTTANKQDGTAGSDENGSAESGSKVTDQGNNSDNSGDSTGSGSTGGSGTGRSGSGGR